MCGVEGCPASSPPHGGLHAPLRPCSWHGWERAPAEGVHTVQTTCGCPAAVRWTSHTSFGLWVFKPERTLSSAWKWAAIVTVPFGA